MGRTSTGSSPAHPIVIGGAVLVGLGACAAVLIAVLTEGLICGESGECRSGLMTAQLLIALLGLLPAGGLFWASLRGRYLIALVCFISVVILYLTWGVLNDAAVHGWDDLRVF